MELMSKDMILDQNPILAILPKLFSFDDLLDQDYP